MFAERFIRLTLSGCCRYGSDNTISSVFSEQKQIQNECQIYEIVELIFG